MRRPLPCRLALATLALVLSCPTMAAIYRCDVNGQAVFADSPCGDNAETVDVEPLRTGGRLDTGTQVEFYRPPRREVNTTSPTGCPAGYIQSSELRRMRVRRRVREGLSADQVRYILGDPDRRDGQWWVYEHQGEEIGRYRIRQGCLARWR
ncbi:MAG: hypothetical protein R3175_15015 [Marinobacter sp.]|uniref:DUF4124 domain-containing protein n=1 Tax=Marinobacter sp. TaxID=50741 RepID=UPI00299ED2C7|nr:DUF4124 domain-containing protein [Marinobacter sp.]MDX1757366.1 hypothetical protein [Marinobacter sp.]